MWPNKYAIKLKRTWHDIVTHWAILEGHEGVNFLRFFKIKILKSFSYMANVSGKYIYMF